MRNERFWGLRRGDRVEYRTAWGNLKGKVVFAPAYNNGNCVVNLGGRYGRAGAFTESEFVRKVGARS